MQKKLELHENMAGIARFGLFICLVLSPICLPVSTTVSAAELELPDGIATHADGRKPIEELYAAYTSLLEKGWQLDIIIQSQPGNRAYALPVIALRTPHGGQACWILSGIHGEEPAGPNAIGASIDAIAALGERRADAASSAEADAITAYILKLSAQYPPAASIDLHEDNLISEGYVYSQGKLGAADPIALAAVQTLKDNGIPLKMSGETRFGEVIEGGIIGPVIDGSVDELMSARSIIVDGRPQLGPAAHTVLVFETPAGQVSLQRRIDAHTALLKSIKSCSPGNRQACLL